MVSSRPTKPCPTLADGASEIIFGRTSDGTPQDFAVISESFNCPGLLSKMHWLCDVSVKEKKRRGVARRVRGADHPR